MQTLDLMRVRTITNPTLYQFANCHSSRRLRLLHIPCLRLFPGRTSPGTAFTLPVAGKCLRELGSLPYCGTLPVEDVNRDCDQDCKTREYGGGIFELVALADVRVHCDGVLAVVAEYSGYRSHDSLGVAYIAAMPARKSLARPLPPVAEAEYGP